MSAMNSEAMVKLLKAKQLEKEALLSLLPDSLGNHLEVICKELQAMAVETVLAFQDKDKESGSTSTSQEPRVIKVDIV